jgi:hypothetical protein
MTATVLALSLALAGRAGGTDFLRGDVNGDGIVSLADVHRLQMYIYGGSPPPECLMAADVDDDDHVGYFDALALRLFSLFEELWPPPAPPYPEPGPDPTGAVPDPESPAVTCEGYGNASVLDDPESRIEVRDAVAAGGREAVAVLTLALTSPRPSAGFLGRLRVEGDVIGRNPFYLSNLVLADDFNYWSWAGPIDDSIVFYAEADLLRTRRALPVVEDANLTTLTLCLRPGARAGVYPIALESAEVIEWGTGRSVRASVAAGTLTLLRDVVSTTDWCAAEPTPWYPVDVEFRVGDAFTRPGRSFSVPFTVRSSADFHGYSFSIDFNEDVLECTSLEQVWQRPGGVPYPFENHDINNRSVHPGNGEPDEGAVMGVIPLDGGIVPADTETVLFDMHFRVRPGVLASTVTRIHVREGAIGPRFGYDAPQGNGVWVRPGGHRYPTIRVAGRVEIVGEGSEHFVRGDSNGDDRVEVSDAVHTLEHLFLGGPAPRCPDAADANDSGRVDIADPIGTLAFLFLGAGSSLPPPFPGLGKDPTPDGLACGAPP